MSCGGTSAPLKKVGVGGWEVRCAQSRGEWPGVRMTFLEGRAEGARVEEVAAKEENLPVVKDFGGGPRSVEASDGGGLREFPNFGSGRSALGRVEGGGISWLAEIWDMVGSRLGTAALLVDACLRSFESEFKKLLDIDAANDNPCERFRDSDSAFPSCALAYLSFSI